jgi:flagellar hook protein FlgE
MISGSIGARMMQGAANQMAKIAQNVANADTPGYKRFDLTSPRFDIAEGTSPPPQPVSELRNSVALPPSDVDLATEMVNLIKVENAYAMGVRLVRAEDEMLSTALELKR